MTLMAVSPAACCLLCQQSNTLILLEAKEVLDHTHFHKHTHLFPPVPTLYLIPDDLPAHFITVLAPELMSLTHVK